VHGYKVVPDFIRDQIYGCSSDTFRIGRIRKYEGSAARSGDTLTCPTCWVPVAVAN
jgi:hypothetical protein